MSMRELSCQTPISPTRSRGVGKASDVASIFFKAWMPACAGMTKTVCLLSLMIAVTACGIKRPVMPPKDIPAYEARQKKKLEKYKDEKKDVNTSEETETTTPDDQQASTN